MQFNPLIANRLVYSKLFNILRNSVLPNSSELKRNKNIREPIRWVSVKILTVTFICSLASRVARANVFSLPLFPLLRCLTDSSCLLPYLKWVLVNNPVRPDIFVVVSWCLGHSGFQHVLACGDVTPCAPLLHNLGSSWCLASKKGA